MLTPFNEKEKFAERPEALKADLAAVKEETGDLGLDFFRVL